MNYPFASRLGVAALALFAASTAGAEERASETDADDEPIIVTGQKRERTLQETTDSVVVTASEVIEREPVRDLYDLIERVPNVTALAGERGFSIRGVPQPGVSGRGSTLLVFVDDSPLGRRTTFFGPTDTWDLETLEVYRGPQSTNFGRGALAGAIYLRTRDPGYDWSLDARAEIGEANLRQAAIAGGGAIIDDRLAFRASANHIESDGFITNTLLDQDADPIAVTTGRFKLLFEPTASLRIVSTTTFTENEAGEGTLNARNFMPIDPLPAGEVRREVGYETPGIEGSETFLQSLRAQWELSPAVTLESITTYQQSDYFRQLDGDNTADPLSVSIRTNDDEVFTQELRANFSSGRFSGVIGAYLFDNSDTQTDDFTIPFGFLIPGIPLDILLARDSDLSLGTTNYAAFAQGEFALTDRIDLIAGLRYDYEEFESVSRSVSTSAAPLPPGFGFLGGFFGEENESIRASYDAWLPKAGLRWRASDTVNLAVTAQRAYQAGGGIFDVIDGQVNQFDPEYLWNYELSLRSLWLDGRLRFNANAYYSDWSNQQVPERRADFPFVILVSNAGESTLYGFEADATFEATDTLQVYGALGYAHTEFDTFPNIRFDPTQPVSPGNQSDFSGNRFPGGPRFSANFGISYDATKGARSSGPFGGFDANYQSGVFNEAENFVANFCCERLTVNARAGYAWENFRVSVLARNLFDEDYFTLLNVNSGSAFAELGDPRVFWLRVDASF